MPSLPPVSTTRFPLKDATSTGLWYMAATSNVTTAAATADLFATHGMIQLSNECRPPQLVLGETRPVLWERSSLSAPGDTLIHFFYEAQIFVWGRGHARYTSHNTK
eukprot:m.105784 g.105784  ORF g.105784 m.105784 type:complete len:106 (-) comp12661_c0_seq3:639-956(-)